MGNGQRMVRWARENEAALVGEGGVTAVTVCHGGGALIGAPNDEHGPHRHSLKGPYPFTFVVPTFVNPFHEHADPARCCVTALLTPASMRPGSKRCIFAALGDSQGSTMQAPHVT